MKKTYPSILLAITLGLALVAPVQAETFLQWSYGYSDDSGTVDASGILSVAGDASSPEAVLSFTGQRNGDTITGLVPLGSDSGRFLYDNMFTTHTPQVSWYGILFNVVGPAEHVNLYFDQGSYREVSYFGTNTPVDHAVTFQTSSVSAVPEPETLAMFLVGLGMVGLMKSRKNREQSPSFGQLSV